ncbi:hypothetical protein WA026_012954 [Henosepilachna vigintioctopunctata]|uniref:Methylosome subunit pICln n=1 Tax=Henosepilachna vigintioctopunctata TaxID=420089 RepID=A0AAW1TSB2_9CUCU
MVIVTSFVQPESSIRLLQHSVRAVLDKKDLGKGTLYVSERNLCWQERDELGFQIDYHSISLHATSKDPNVYPEECIYILINSHICLPGYSPIQDETDDQDSDDESEPEISELILIPESPSLLSSIYEAIKICQELNPDPNDMDDDDDQIYEDAEENMDEYYEIESEDCRAGGDAMMDDLAHRLEDNYLHSNNIRNGTANGDGNCEDEDHFEDAD